MIFGIPREITEQETRVGAMPFLAKELIRRGHEVLVETGAGEFCDAGDPDYEQVGATIVPSAEKLYANAETILKVREPKPVEYDLIRPDQNIFAFFHFLNNAERVKAIASRGCTCLAYEYVRNDHGEHVLMLPISRITGQLAIINGAYFLQSHSGGKGVLMGRVTGSSPANVLIIGAGNVGKFAAITAAKMGANVTILDTDYNRLHELDLLGYNNLTSIVSSDEIIRKLLPKNDLVVTCIQKPFHPTPRVITKDMIRTMKKGSVIVEVDIDFGGSVETGKELNPLSPTMVVDGVVHYCVSNISAGVPRVASEALSAALMPFIREIAETGFEEAILKNPVIKSGIAIYKGHVIKPYLAELSQLPLSDLDQKVAELTPNE
ncbi:MAG: alanine dehydrogenase [Calditrichia bacterium]